MGLQPGHRPTASAGPCVDRTLWFPRSATLERHISSTPQPLWWWLRSGLGTRRPAQKGSDVTAWAAGACSPTTLPSQCTHWIGHRPKKKKKKKDRPRVFLDGIIWPLSTTGIKEPVSVLHVTYIICDIFVISPKLNVVDRLGVLAQ